MGRKNYPRRWKKRHHNNSGYRQIRRGKTRIQIKRLAKKLGIPYKVLKQGKRK